MSQHMSLLTGRMVERRPPPQNADLAALLARIDDLEARESAAMNRLVAIMVERDAERMVEARLPKPAAVEVAPPVAVAAPIPAAVVAPVAVAPVAPVAPVALNASWDLSVTARDSMTAIKSIRIVSGGRVFVLQVTKRDAIDQILNMTLQPE